MRGITIIFNDEEIHTGNGYDLVQEEKEIETPDAQSYRVEVPGRNGLLNLSKSLTGKIIYTNRELTFQFFGSGDRRRLLWLQDQFNRYHGETIQIIDDDTPGYYYEGEASVSSDIKGTYIIIKLKVNADPFRLARDTDNVTVALSSTVKEIEIYNRGVEVVPTVSVTSSAVIVKGDYTATLNAGTYDLAGLELTKGANIFKVKGSGTLVISYREAII